jgi:hypothetical protein
MSLIYGNISKTVMLLHNYDISRTLSAWLQAAKARVQPQISPRYGQNYTGTDFSLRTSVSPDSYLYNANEDPV